MAPMITSGCSWSMALSPTAILTPVFLSLEVGVSAVLPEVVSCPVVVEGGWKGILHLRLQGALALPLLIGMSVLQ